MQIPPHIYRSSNDKRALTVVLELTERELNLVIKALDVVADSMRHPGDTWEIHTLEDLAGILGFEDASETDHRHSAREKRHVTKR